MKIIPIVENLNRDDFISPGTMLVEQRKVDCRLLQVASIQCDFSNIYFFVEDVQKDNESVRYQSNDMLTSKQEHY